MVLKEIRFKRLYVEKYPKVKRLCLGYVGGNESLAKDLAQETFLKIWINLENFRNESNIDTWVYRITVNTCLAAIKKEKQQQVRVNIDSVQVAENTPEPVNKELMLSKLYSCVNTLNDTNKAIILLELEGLPQQEIAAVVGLRHEAIRTRIHRIKDQLTKCVHHE